VRCDKRIEFTVLSFRIPPHQLLTARSRVLTAGNYTRNAFISPNCPRTSTNCFLNSCYSVSYMFIYPCA